MAITHTFTNDEDYIGLEEEGKLLLTTHALGKGSNNVEKTGANGAYVASRTFGTTCAPSCSYEIVSAIEQLKKRLGKVYQSTRALATGPIALRSFTISTSAGGKPSFTAEGVEIESGATHALHEFETTAIAISPAYEALLFGAATFTESATVALNESTYTAECSLDPTKVDGVPVASDATAGKETVTLRFWSSNGAPSITVASGWNVTSPLTRTRDDGDFEVWECTLTHYLAASTPSNS